MKYQSKSRNYKGWVIQFNEESFTAYNPSDATVGYWVRETIAECKAIIDQKTQ